MAEQIVNELERLAGEHAPCRITRVVLEVGALQQVVDELLSFAVQVAARGTAADGAELEICKTPARCTCNACGGAFEVEQWNYLCPGCGSGDVTRHSGDELVIENITIEKEEPAAVAATMANEER